MENEVDVRSGWSMADNRLSAEDGWYVHHYGKPQQAYIGPTSGYGAGDRYKTSSEAFTHVLESALCGDPLAYKALRVVVKTNPFFAQYKSAVRNIYRQYFRAR